MPTHLNNFQVVSYPRSGLNLLRILLGQQGYSIASYHRFEGIDKNTDILTIVRNPLDTVSSYFSMVKSHMDTLDYPGINKMLQTYIETYTWLLNNYSYILDYNDLANSPNTTIERLLSHYDLPHSQIKYRLDLLKDDPSEKYLVSSKNTEWYEASRQYTMSSALIEEADDIYRQMLFSN